MSPLYDSLRANDVSILVFTQILITFIQFSLQGIFHEFHCRVPLLFFTYRPVFERRQLNYTLCTLKR